MTNSSKVSGNRGRPPDPAKREAIINAAGALFLESEMGDISMDDLAKKAKVSKITVYKHFSDKRELFQTMIEKKMEANLSGSLFARLQGQDAFEDLATIARGFTNIIYSKDGVNMYRTVVAESKRGADIPQMFYAKAVEPSNKLLEAHLSKLERTGEYAFPDKRLAASVFFSMFKGDRFLRAVMTLPEHEKQGETEGFVRQMVRLYLKMFKLPEQKVIIDNRKQHYLAQLNKLISGVHQFIATLQVAIDSVVNPSLLNKLQQTSSSMLQIKDQLQGLWDPQQDTGPSLPCPVFAAMCQQAGTEIHQDYVVDRLRDEIIAGHFVRILEFASTFCGQLADSALALQLKDDRLPGIKNKLATMAMNFAEKPQ